MKDEDIKGAKRSFPDFILESTPLVNLMRLTTNPANDQPVFTLVPKDIILHPYLSPLKPEVIQDGYQTLSW